MQLGQESLIPSERFSVPLVGQLIPDGVKPGTIFVVEYDPESQWLAVATTITAHFLLANGRVNYMTALRSPEDVRYQLDALGVDAPAAEKDNRLLVDDWFSATLTGGRLESAELQTGLFEPIQGGVRVRSLKIADLSIAWLKDAKQGFQPYDVVETWPPGTLAIEQSDSEILRFNEENAFVEWMRTRVVPNERRAKRIHLAGFVLGIHSESLYKRMENSCDGVIDIRVMERGEEAKNLLRVRSLKGQPHDSRWHEIEIKPNGEAILAN